MKSVANQFTIQARMAITPQSDGPEQARDGEDQAEEDGQTIPLEVVVDDESHGVLHGAGCGEAVVSMLRS